MLAQLLSVTGSGCDLPSGAGGSPGSPRAVPCLSHGPASPCPQPAVTRMPGTEGCQGGSGSFVTVISNAMQNKQDQQRELTERGQEEKGEV